MTMRISGLASGMDIDQMVSDLMKAERMPLDKLKQQKQTLEWKRDDYRSMNTLLLDFRSQLTQYKLTTMYRARQTASSDESKVTSTATGAASQSSYNINNVTSLASAASRVSGISGDNNEKISSATSKIDPSKGLYSLKGSFDTPGATWDVGVINSTTIKADGTTDTINLGSNLKDPGSTSVKVNGKSYEVVTTLPTSPDKLGSNQVHIDSTGKLTFASILPKDSSIQVDYVTANKTQTIDTTNSLKEFQLSNGSINTITLKLGGTDYTLGNDVSDGYTELAATDSNGIKQVIGKINKETGKIIFDTEQAAGTSISVDYKQNYANFSLQTYNKDGQKNVNFLVQGNESLNAVVNKVNTSDAGISMMYDSFSDRISMTRTETGNFNPNGNEITTNGEFLNTLLKFGGTNSSETGGTNLEFEINGLSTKRYSNTFEMNGVTFTIKDKFSSTNGVTTSVSNNSSDVFDNIKSFVDKYNELIDKIGKKTSETFYKDYGPLTDTQREGLSDKQQEQWEEKAKSGLLRRDPTLNRVLNKMRSDFYQPVDNASVNPLYKQLSNIGITTTSNYLEGGKLVIDEAKLKKAIEDDPTSVENLFRGGSDATDSSQKGIIHRLYDSVNATMDQLKEKAGNTFSTNQQFTLGRQLTDVSSRITSFEDRMKQVEDRYYRQFTAMEKAIQQSNQQATYLMQQFGGGQ